MLQNLWGKLEEIVSNRVKPYKSEGEREFEEGGQSTYKESKYQR